MAISHKIKHNLYENISLTNVNIYIYFLIWGGFCPILGGLLSGGLLSVPHGKQDRSTRRY